MDVMKLSPKKALLNRLIDSLDRISLGAYLSPLHGARWAHTFLLTMGLAGRIHDDKLTLTINRQPIGEWFKEQWEKLRQGLRQSAEAPQKSRGLKL